MLTLRQMVERSGYNMLELKLHLKHYMEIGTLFSPNDLITCDYDDGFELYFAFYPLFDCDKALGIHWHVYKHYDHMEDQLHWFEEKYRSFYNKPSNFFTNEHANDGLYVCEAADFVWFWWD